MTRYQALLNGLHCTLDMTHNFNPAYISWTDTILTVRHHLEHTIRSNISLNMLALRVNTVIFQKFQKMS